MPSLGDLTGDERDRNARAIAKSQGRFEVATTTPFEVYLDGSTTAVEGWKVVGLTYIVGTTGMYWLRQGQKPLCIPTE
jgi:hypothetical protein